MSICYDFVLELIAEIKNKPYNMNKFAKDGLLSSSLSTIILLYTKKKHKDNSLCFFWRGRRDSNSRAGFPTYALSRGASSPT